MKGIVRTGIVLLYFFFSSCMGRDAIQVQTVGVRLVGIDTLQRTDRPVKMLTWVANNRVRYVTIENINAQFSVGERMTVLTKR